MLLEVCCGNILSVRNAADAHAQRIELCAALGLGGITPSQGFFKESRKIFNGHIQVLIRPREGNFVYNEDEVDEIIHDVKFFRDNGADGIVFGALTIENEIDVNLLHRIIELSYPLKVTFHRAIDECNNSLLGLQQIIDAGCERVLTSGKQKSALGGLEQIKEMAMFANGKISIMPGGGININNLQNFKEIETIHEIHSSCSVPAGNLPKESLFSNQAYMLSSTELIQKMMESLQ